MVSKQTTFVCSLCGEQEQADACKVSRRSNRERCSKCGGNLCRPEELGIKLQPAKKSPKRNKPKVRKRKLEKFVPSTPPFELKHYEPEMMQCPKCDAEYTSRQLIKMKARKHRCPKCPSEFLWIKRDLEEHRNEQICWKSDWREAALRS